MVVVLQRGEKGLLELPAAAARRVEHIRSVRILYRVHVEVTQLPQARKSPAPLAHCLFKFSPLINNLKLEALNISVTLKTWWIGCGFHLFFEFRLSYDNELTKSDRGAQKLKSY